MPPDASKGERFDRRTVLRAGLQVALGGGAAALLAGCAGGRYPTAARSGPGVPGPGSRPEPHLAAGTDLLPGVDHVIVVMLRGHSFDNVLGAARVGDGLTFDAGGRSRETNPDGKGEVLAAFAMPTPCQVPGSPSDTWDASHVQWDRGTNQGFVRSASGPVAMGYFGADDLPFTYGLARTFAVSDRYFSSVLASSVPNRRFLLAGTSLGLVGDTPHSALPRNGTIFDALDRYGIPWKNYCTDQPTMGVFPALLDRPSMVANLAPIAQFYADLFTGALPSFALVDPSTGPQSEADPADVQYGDEFLAQVVHAAMSSPQWSRILLVWTYDTHGGYFDHVPPPGAPVPDGLAPSIRVPPDQKGGFGRYGFRVPLGVVSPYARPGFVSHEVGDHTSILRLVEAKWNLPALTQRDAHAHDLLDMVDLAAPPAFLSPPALPPPTDPVPLSGCTTTGPGSIPPAGAVLPARGGSPGTSAASGTGVLPRQ